MVSGGVIALGLFMCALVIVGTLLGIYYSKITCPDWGSDCPVDGTAPAGMTPVPAGMTPVPARMTPAPAGMTPAPAGMTPVPAGMTPAPAAPPCPSGTVSTRQSGKCCPSGSPALMSDNNTCCPHTTDTVQSGKCVIQGYSLMSDGFTQCPTGQVLVSPGTAAAPGMCAPQISITDPPRIQISGKPCYVGYYASGNQCLPCAAGKSSDGQTCSNCPAAQSSDPPNGKYTCENCPVGKSSSSGGLCTNCASGTTNTMAGSLCCPAGQTSIAGAPCQAPAATTTTYTKTPSVLTNYLGTNDFQIGSDIFTQDTLDNCKQICSSTPGCSGFHRQNFNADTAVGMCTWKAQPIGTTRIANSMWDTYIKN